MRKSITLFLLLGLAACTSQPERQTVLINQPKTEKAPPSCADIQLAIEKLENASSTELYTPSTGLNPVPYNFRRDNSEKIATLKALASKQNCLFTQSEANAPSHSTQPGLIETERHRLSFDQCFSKCKELTDRSNEACFDSCK